MVKNNIFNMTRYRLKYPLKDIKWECIQKPDKCGEIDNFTDSINFGNLPTGIYKFKTVDLCCPIECEINLVEYNPIKGF